MSTEAAATSHQTPTPHEPMENELNKEVKPVDQEIVSLAKKAGEEEEEEKLKVKELPSQVTPLSKSQGEVEGNLTVPAAVEFKKIGDESVMDVPVENKMEPVSEAGKNSEPVGQTIVESVINEAEVQPTITLSMDKAQQEQPKMADITAPSVEAIENPQESSEALPIKELEAQVVKDSEKSETVSKELHKPESVVPEVGEKLEEQFEATELVEKPELVATTEKQQEPLEILLIKESEAVIVKDVEDSEAVSKGLSEVETKLEEQSEVSKQVEKPELVVPAIEVKREQSLVCKQVEIKSTDEKLEPVLPDIQTEVTGQVELKHKEMEPKRSIERETVKGERTCADKVEDKRFFEEEKTGKEEEPIASSETVGSTDQRAETVCKEGEGLSSLLDVTEKAGVEVEKEEIPGTDLVEGSSKEALVEVGNVGEEKEAQSIKAECENVERDVLNEELTQAIKMEDVKNAVSNAEVTEKSSVGEKNDDGLEPVVGTKSIKEETPAIIATSKELDEATTTVNEPVKDSQYSDPEAKEEGAESGEDKLEKENIEEIAKSDIQNLEVSTKDGDGTIISQDLTREVPAKPTQKQSNSLLTKVKQSLVKAKKAIIGKPSSSKTLSSDTKGDLEVK